MTKKNFLFLSAAVVATTVAGLAFVVTSGITNHANHLAANSQIIDGSVTWTDVNSEKTVHQGNKASFGRKTSRGTDIYLYSYGNLDLSDGLLLHSKRNDDLGFGIRFNSEDSTDSELFKFQNITSVSIKTASTSEEGAGFLIYTNSSATGIPAVSQTNVSGETTYTFSTEVAGGNYLTIKPYSSTAVVDILSVTVNYSCDPEYVEPSYTISYFGQEGLNVVPLYGIDTTSLVTSAKENEQVVINPVALDGYTYMSGYGYSENVEDVYSDEHGTITFKMPAENVEFVLVAQLNAVTLSSITLSGDYPTEFTVGDTFSSEGLVVTANYSDSSSKVIGSGYTITGYDMSKAGVQEVTVSYTEDEVTKTASYNITVTSGSTEVVLSGTYNYASRKHAIGAGYVDWTLYTMTITFNSDGTCTWRNQRTNILGNAFDCKVYYTYTATDNGANITIKMASVVGGSGVGYYFTKDGVENNQASSFSGGGYDRPLNGGFGGATSKNDSGVLSSDKTTLTIDVYDKDHSYEVYDTFTFTLAE